MTPDIPIMPLRRLIPASVSHCAARLGASTLAVLLAGAVASSSAAASTSGTAGATTTTSRVHHAKKKVVRTPAPALLSSYEARLLVLTNQARIAEGVRPLVAEPGPTDVARRWSVVLATQDNLSHNPSVVSALEHAGSPNWTALAENVGMGPSGDPDRIFTAYMNSPHHRANIVDPAMRYVGIGAVSVNTLDNGPMTFDTMDFTNSYTTKYGVDRTHLVESIVADITQLPSLLRLGH